MKSLSVVNKRSTRNSLRNLITNSYCSKDQVGKSYLCHYIFELHIYRIAAKLKSVEDETKWNSHTPISGFCSPEKLKRLLMYQGTIFVFVFCSQLTDVHQSTTSLSRRYKKFYQPFHCLGPLRQ